HDDTPGLQAAIDQVGANGGGVLFIPSGTYLLRDTVYVWPGVRILGYGPERPVLWLAPGTPGFQTGDDRYMLYFSGGRGREPGDPPRDGTPGTFYSALCNVDIKIGAGNEAAVAVRFHVAQHCFLSHMNLDLGDARAGLVDIGNLVERLHITGGQIGIDTARSAPGWPIAVLDCTLENQRVAAIRSREGGLAIVRPTIRNTPAAVVMYPDVPDELWISDGRFEDISGPAIVVSRSRNARTQVAMENVACRNVPDLALLRDTGARIAGPAPRYVIDHLTHGLHLGAEGSSREITTKLAARPIDDLPAPVVSDVAALPHPGSWVNVRDLGVVGDGTTDDTAAIRAAITAHRTLYFPMGWYNVADTLTLREDTVLIGLHPGLTVINLPNDTPAFAAEGDPKALIETPPGGANIVSGIGVYAGERNPRAVGVKWRAGAESLLDDVRFHGGHGTHIPDRRLSRSGDRDHWNTQPASLWVTDGGGGVLKNIWTPNPHARSGLLITNTTTPGRLYVMSAEHHVDHEVVVENASDWRFFALQFEEEREEGPKALPLKIDRCTDLLFANTFFYRVISCFVPAPHAITVVDSANVRFRNVHVYSNSKVSFDSSVYDAHTDTEVRDPEFAVLDLPPATAPVPPATVPSDRVTKLADGFQNIAGAAAAPNGDVYFADAREHRIYRWSHEQQRVEHVLDVPERPEQLAFDRAGHLLVIAYEGEGTVLAFDPANPEAPRRLEPSPSEPRPGVTPILAVSHWGGAPSFPQSATAAPVAHYLSPDGTVFIPADEGFTTGATSWGVKGTPLLRTFGVAPAVPGRPFYVTNELDLRTHAFDVRPDGTLANPRLFAEEGGEGVTTDEHGNVYIAAGRILIYNSNGERIGVIDTPRRPTGLVFGGPNRRTLYVTARDTLYAVSIAE
ncbi:MAG: glycosyl hydrolase family 28-related protein, partial [Phycisphaerales bacterium]|nr:glycosyl hydrolase family 28-related protein [Phycisphaerales bacterium]